MAATYSQDERKLTVWPKVYLEQKFELIFLQCLALEEYDFPKSENFDTVPILIGATKWYQTSHCFEEALLVTLHKLFQSNSSV